MVGKYCCLHHAFFGLNDCDYVPVLAVLRSTKTWSGCPDRHGMVTTAVALFVLSGGLLLSAVLVWFGRIQPFPSSVRANHAGVLGAAGLCVVSSGSLVLMAGVNVGSSVRLLAGGTWMLTFLVFVWMYSQTPNQWASRMARAAEHTFDLRPSQFELPEGDPDLPESGS